MTEALFNSFQLGNYQDARGWLAENKNPEILSGSKHFFISASKPGVIRGNHYHKHKREFFLILKGQAELHLLDLETEKQETVTLNADDRKFIEIKPNIVHALKNTGDDELLLMALVNEVFDPKAPDTYHHELIS